MSDIHNLGFEPLHHEEIGNSVILRFGEDEVLSGKDENFTNNLSFSFGLVVALTGDFFGEYTTGIGDVDQLSDTWNTWPAKSVLRSAPRMAKYLQNDQAGIVERVIDLMRAQRNEFDEKVKDRKEDAIQVYKDIAAKYSAEYVKATERICDKIALCNWDHFGKGAIKAYSAFHTAALKKAKDAYQAMRPDAPEDPFGKAITKLEDTLNRYGTRLEKAKTAHISKIDQEEKAKELETAADDHITALREATDGLSGVIKQVEAAYKQKLNPKTTDDPEAEMKKRLEAAKKAAKEQLKTAYFLEACAQHYLSDLFSPGHIRTPRRELHSVHYSGEVHFMDQCAGLMHDEDGTNGLKVTNRENETWTMLDGKWLWGDAGSDKNMAIAKEAAQTSVDEIWKTRESGKIPPRFKVLDKIPNLDFDSPENFTPLFRPEVGRSNILDVRGWRNPLTALDHDRWPMLYEFNKPSPQKNTLLLTSVKRSETETSEDITPSGTESFTWRLRSTSTKLMVNRYDEDVRSSPGLWPSDIGYEYAVPQGFEVILAHPCPPDGDQCISVVGQVKEDNRTYHLGIRFMNPYVTWKQTLPTYNVNPASYKIVHGNFTGGPSFARCWNYAEKRARVEICSLTDMASPPSVVAKQTLETPIDFLLCHSILSFETMKYDDYVCLYGHDSNSKCTTVTWLYCDQPKPEGIMPSIILPVFLPIIQPIQQPNQQPAKVIRHQWKEKCTSPAQAVFEMRHNGIPWLVRTYYGPSYCEGDKIRVDTIHVTVRSEENVEPSISSEVFDLVANGIGRWTEDHHVKWFTSDVKQVGVQDLIALVTNVSKVGDGVNLSFQLLVFPTSGNDSEPTFGTPVVSKIEVPTAGFKAPCMKFSDAHQVVWGKAKKDSAIMLLFGNYGALEARYLVPISDSYEYNLCQTLDST